MQHTLSDVERRYRREDLIVVAELARKHGGSSRMLVEMMLGSTPLDDVNLSNFYATVRDIANQMTRIAA